MELQHPDAPPGKEEKYASVERERRWLLHSIPDGPCVRRALINDRYVVGTRIRLRSTDEMRAEGTTTFRKLTQKVPYATAPGAAEPDSVTPDSAAPDSAAAGFGLITTFYLSDAEYEVLSGLTAEPISKWRYSVPPYGIDVFGGELAGLVIAEAEFADDQSAAAFPDPPEAVAEITADIRLTGGRLVTMTQAELLAILEEYGIPGGTDASDLEGRPLA